MHNLYLERPNLYIGFHGCEKENGINLINNPKLVKFSTTNHEWLGEGFYVWENMQKVLEQRHVQTVQQEVHVQEEK